MENPSTHRVPNSKASHTRPECHIFNSHHQHYVCFFPHLLYQRTLSAGKACINNTDHYPPSIKKKAFPFLLMIIIPIKKTSAGYKNLNSHKKFALTIQCMK